MEIPSEENRSLWGGFEGESPYLEKLDSLYKSSALLFDFSRIASARRERVCKAIAMKLVEEGAVSARPKDLANLLRIIDLLQRSVVYSLFTNDTEIALKTMQDICGKASEGVTTARTFSYLIDTVLELLKPELLVLLDELVVQESGVSAKNELRESLLSIFTVLGLDNSIESQGCVAHRPSASVFSFSYLRRAPDQSAFIIGLFFIAGFSIYSLKYGLISGFCGVMLCLALRVDPRSGEHLEIFE